MSDTRHAEEVQGRAHQSSRAKHVGECDDDGAGDDGVDDECS